MVPEPSIQARSHFSVDPGEIPDRGGIVLALLLGFVEKERKKKKRSESFYRRRRKALRLHRGKNSAEAGLFLRSAESAGQGTKHQALTHS